MWIAIRGMKALSTDGRKAIKRVTATAADFSCSCKAIQTQITASVDILNFQ